MLALMGKTQLEEEMCTMTPFAAVAVKILGGGAAAALLSVGVAGTLVPAATPRPTPNTSTGVPSSPDPPADRQPVRPAVPEPEADRLRLPQGTRNTDLKKGPK